MGQGKFSLFSLSIFFSLFPLYVFSLFSSTYWVVAEALQRPQSKMSKKIKKIRPFELLDLWSLKCHIENLLISLTYANLYSPATKKAQK